MKSIYTTLQKRFISEKARHVGERVVVTIALVAFAVHLILIALRYFDWLPAHSHHLDELLTNPIAAIYTPFSFILVYEVYLLLFYLPQSITQYIARQYEIITLIIVRRIFKDIANLELTTEWFSRPKDLQLTYDIAATLILFLLIILFYRLARSRPVSEAEEGGHSAELRRFIYCKNVISLLLVPMLLGLAIYSFAVWTKETFFMVSIETANVSDVNKVFFEDFFSILVMVDVFLLLLSLIHNDSFPTVIRNSGFVISTILIKISFGAEGIVNVALILAGVSFGVAILWAHNLFERTITHAAEP
tara:strand:- start:309 stop:1220 length:912 start_codon:yes stop_codon:yes gene_type:complete